MSIKTIAYIEEEDLLELEVERALKRSMDENFRLYCQLIGSLLALYGVDVTDAQQDKSIYYIDE